jgi:transcriptional regulator with XRE-family HTH domain
MSLLGRQAPPRLHEWGCNRRSDAAPITSYLRRRALGRRGLLRPRRGFANTTWKLAVIKASGRTSGAGNMPRGDERAPSQADLSPRINADPHLVATLLKSYRRRLKETDPAEPVQRLRFTQRVLAKLVGVSSARISSLEQGEWTRGEPPPVWLLSSICEVLGVTDPEANSQLAAAGYDLRRGSDESETVMSVLSQLLPLLHSIESRLEALEWVSGINAPPAE